MKNLIWGLAFLAMVVGIAVAIQKRNAAPSDVSQGESRVRRALPSRPHLPSTDVGETLGEAIEGAAGEVAPPATTAT